jgi:hypothetical protein
MRQIGRADRGALARHGVPNDPLRQSWPVKRSRAGLRGSCWIPDTSTPPLCRLPARSSIQAQICSGCTLPELRRCERHFRRSRRGHFRLRLVYVSIAQPHTANRLDSFFLPLRWSTATTSADRRRIVPAKRVRAAHRHNRVHRLPKQEPRAL